MAGFYLYTSNHSEVLAGRLAEIIKRQPLPVFTPETIVVQSRGMARWLTMEMAGRLPVWANSNFPFPNHFIIEVTRKLLPESDTATLYERGKGVWQIMTLLREYADHPWFTPLRHYQKDVLRRYQLAGIVADLFDQYIIFRPDLIAEWDEGGRQNWQAELWHQLKQRYGQSHRGVLRDKLLSCLNQSEVSHLLPERIAVFGVSSLPPFHLSILEGLARQTEIHFFLITPCRHWWGHILDAGQIARRVKGQKKSAEELYLEEGNPLLASMGCLGRDFLNMLQDLETEELEEFVDPGDDTMLTALQRDILELSDGMAASVAADDSIIINSCHSPMREIEVLQDHLLRLFELHPDLEPRDIVVMAPDINIYAPLVEAVFEVGPDRNWYIPYNISDRGQTRENPLLPIFLGLLDLGDSRFEVSRVLDLLQARQVRRRFDLSEEDLEMVKYWLKQVSIHWGRDREHLQSLGLPRFDAYCWRSGLDRLLLGLCMAEEGVFDTLAPFAEINEGDMELLARTLEALHTLFAKIKYLEKDQTLADWSAILVDILDSCLDVDRDEENHLQSIRDILGELKEQSGQSLLDEKLPLAVIRKTVEKKLNDQSSISGYLGGGVTFCSLLPMRAVPFKIVCLLGMTDGSFPRVEPRINFDLTAENQRPGDRSRRLDDRYLFLEALISARRQFYLSYVGQSVYDDTDKPPSVLVDELLDYLSRMTGKSRDSDSGAFIASHRLQPFHPDYFRTGSSYSSYSVNDWEAARQSLRRLEKEDQFNFWQNLPLPPPAETEKGGSRRLEGEQVLALDELTDFLLHPVRHFCRYRLGIDLSMEESLPDDEEPLRLVGLNLYQLSLDMSRSQFPESGERQMEELFRARGQLPPGEMGKAALFRLRAEVLELMRRLKKYDSRLLPLLEFEVPCGAYMLRGVFSDLRENGFVHVRPARLKGKDILRAWLRHLVLCLLAEDDDGLYTQSAVIGKDREITLSGVSQPAAILTGIIDLYRVNICRPLPLFSETSHAFAREKLVGKTDRSLKKAEAQWLGNSRIPGEMADPWLEFRYRQELPLGAEFQELALKIFKPIYEHVCEC